MLCQNACFQRQWQREQAEAQALLEKERERERERERIRAVEREQVPCLEQGTWLGNR